MTENVAKAGSTSRASKPRKSTTTAKSPPKAGTKAADAEKPIPHTFYHKDGSIYGRGQKLGGRMHGYWEFYRKDGTIMRSGSFDRDRQIGTWTTYDAGGRPVKVTEMKAGAKAGLAAGKTRPAAGKVQPARTDASATADKRPVKLLSGGNPQIAKADGDAPVQAYIAAMPGWKRDLGRRLDAIIVRAVPGVRKAVKWNSPFYGLEGRGWFLSFHVFSRYVKVTFFRGASLRPVPPGGTPKSKDARWIDIHEGDRLDEARLATWVQQAAALPGWDPGRPSR